MQNINCISNLGYVDYPPFTQDMDPDFMDSSVWTDDPVVPIASDAFLVMEGAEKLGTDKIRKICHYQTLTASRNGNRSRWMLLRPDRIDQLEGDEEEPLGLGCARSDLLWRRFGKTNGGYMEVVHPF